MANMHIPFRILVQPPHVDPPRMEEEEAPVDPLEVCAVALAVVQGARED